jgi:hypothetical protein
MKETIELHHLIWNKPLVSSMGKPLSRRRQKSLRIGSFILKFKKRLLDRENESLYPSIERTGLPLLSEQDSYTPPRYFSKGALEDNKQKNPAPITYLLVETNEEAKAHPVPGNALLLRSLCKGKGTLHQNAKGFVYLDIDNRFILSLIPYLKAFGLVRAPYFNLLGPPEGAHVPVISSREASFHYLDEIKVDKEISFEIDGLYSAEPTFWEGVERVWFFQVNSPELEALRRKHFLLSRPAGHPFHIAVAVKPESSVAKTQKPLPIMRINTAYLAA